MIGSDNQARILDFGIGSLLVENEGESLVDTMSTANTLTSGLDCASPESIMEPTNRTPAGDQYSLGCVLYYALTGRVPFPEGSAVEKMMAHQTKEPVPVRELAPEVPEGLAEVVKKLMSKTADGRYNGCDELVEALEEFVGDVSKIPGGVPSAPAPGSRPAMSGLSSGSRAGLGPRSNPGSRLTLPSKHAATPAPSPSPIPPNTRTPEPQPGRGPANLPSRAAFQIPGLQDAAKPPKSSPGAAPKLPTRASTAGFAVPAKPEPAEDDSPAWADEDASEPKKATFGAVGIVAAALLVMVFVYIGATMLMK
jgi:serine/threonine-protein kinase